MWEEVGDRTELQHIDPHSIGHNHVSFPFSWAAQPGAWGPTLLGAGFLYHILSPKGLVSKLIWSPTATAPSGAWGSTLMGSGFLYRILSPTNWLPVFTELYNSSTSTFLWASQIALIQAIHGQGCNIPIDWMHLLFTKVHFLFWQPGRVVGQYTTIVNKHL